MADVTAPRRRIALIAHDNKKQDMLEWAGYNRALLAGHELIATATTGRILRDELKLPVTALRSGPFGGDQQIGGLIADGQIDLLIFFWDPLAPHPHDPDVKALLRVAVLWNIPVACNRSTADFVISSPLISQPPGSGPAITPPGADGTGNGDTWSPVIRVAGTGAAAGIRDEPDDQ